MQLKGKWGRGAKEIWKYVLAIKMEAQPIRQTNQVSAQIFAMPIRCRH